VRFRLLSCDAEGGLNLAIDAVVEKALNYETREMKGIRTWSPAVYQTIQQLFKLTHCVGDSYIVADPNFPYRLDEIPYDVTQLMEYWVLFNLCGNHELPFDIHDYADISRWVAALPKYSVVILNSLSKWAPFSDGLRLAGFHRLWRSTAVDVALVKGAWRKSELRYQSLMVLWCGFHGRCMRTLV